MRYKYAVIRIDITTRSPATCHTFFDIASPVKKQLKVNAQKLFYYRLAESAQT